MFEVKLEGIDDLNRALKDILKQMDPNKIEPILMSGARIISNAARQKVPVGKTGRLKQAIKTKQLKRYGKDPAPAISAIDRKKAPHAHLVEYGTGPRYGKKGKKSYRGKYFGIMPAQPFFRPAVDENKAKVVKNVVEKIKKLVMGVVK